MIPTVTACGNVALTAEQTRLPRTKTEGDIPLTALALKQGGYDWGYLAYAVGFGGSMIWFGSSAGVALCSMYPQGRSVATISDSTGRLSA